MESKLCSSISEAGSYSYCAVVALTLQKLFPGDSDESFRLKTIKDLCRHLDSEVRIHHDILCGIRRTFLHHSDWQSLSNTYSRNLGTSNNQGSHFQVKPVMIALVSGEISGEFDPYLKILRDEPEIQGDFSVFVKDLILSAVKNGKLDACTLRERLDAMKSIGTPSGPDRDHRGMCCRCL